MSETEYSRLAEQLAQVLTAVGVINEKLAGYIEFRQDMQNLKTEVKLMQQNCTAIQAAKEKRTINWGAVWGFIIGAIILALITKYLPI